MGWRYQPSYEILNIAEGFMPYLIFGFALGTFVCGLIEHFHRPDEAGWIKSSYLFALSGIGFLIFIYVAWPQLVEIFS